MNQQGGGDNRYICSNCGGITRVSGQEHPSCEICAGSRKQMFPVNSAEGEQIREEFNKRGSGQQAQDRRQGQSGSHQRGPGQSGSRRPSGSGRYRRKRMKAASSGMRNFIKGAVVVAAVAGLGLLGYYGYKKYKNRPQPRKRMRAYLRARYVTNNFYKAYSYFGPDFKAKISKREYVTARENVPYEIRKLREGIKPRIMEFNKSGDTVSATVVLKDVPDLKKAMAQQMEDLSLKEVSKMSDMSEKRSRRKFWEGLDPETVPRKNIEKKFYMSYINGKWWVDGDPTEVETDK